MKIEDKLQALNDSLAAEKKQKAVTSAAAAALVTSSGPEDESLGDGCSAVLLDAGLVYTYSQGATLRTKIYRVIPPPPTPPAVP